MSVKKKTCLFSEGCEKSEVVNRDSSEKVKPGALHYEMTKSSGTQLRQNSAVDKKVSWAINLHFKCGQKPPNPRNCCMDSIISAAVRCVGATILCLFTPWTAIWKTTGITWKSLVPVECDGSYKWWCCCSPMCSLCAWLRLSLLQLPSPSTATVCLHSQYWVAAAFQVRGAGGRG